jgi:acyl-homoserine-lactone acylase
MAVRLLSRQRATAGVDQPRTDDEPARLQWLCDQPANTPRSGNALLLINPHTSFYFRGEVHVVSDEGLNAYGAVTWGQFFVYQGFNAHTGWMHTSTGVDFMDEFVEDVVETTMASCKYRYGDELRPVEGRRVTLRYRDGDDYPSAASRFIARTTVRSRTASTDRWVATRINWDPVNALRQSWLRARSRMITPDFAT